MPLAELVTERLRLRPMRASDAAPLLSVFGDPTVMAAFDRGPFTPAEMEAWVARNLAHQQTHGFGLFTMELRSSDEVIGDCGLEIMELEGRRQTELGYDLRADQWGHGLATEAAAAVARHAFEVLGLPRLISLVRTGNERSARVARRIGMTFDREVSTDGIAYAVFVLPAPDGGTA